MGLSARESGFPALAGMDRRTGAAARARMRIPRARGDGPGPAARPARAVSDSPRSRGWTRGRRRQVLPRGGFPALAGMDPGGAAARPAAYGIPRARGDGPMFGAPSRTEGRDSPRSRGWTRGGGAARAGGRGFPALAGMDRGRCAVSRSCAGIPRARGDGPEVVEETVWPNMDSPRSRGWTRAERAARDPDRGFPALAGMDRRTPSLGRPSLGIPRARGDGPCGYIPVRRGARDSPRSRGWTRGCHGIDEAHVGFPALAGMDPAPGPG